MVDNAFTSHPSGTWPISESTKRVGRASKTSWGMEGKEVCASALVFTGSKSTNHARKIACASRSSSLRRLPVLFNLVVERAEDVGDGALLRRGAERCSKLEGIYGVGEVFSGWLILKRLAATDRLM